MDNNEKQKDLNIEELKTLKSISEKSNILYIYHKKFTDGTHSKVFLVNDEFLIKINDKLTIAAEKEFFELNTNDYFQKIVFCDEDINYIVYKFIHGTIMGNNLIEENFLNTLKKIIDEYKEYDGSGYGYLHEEKESWIEFLAEECMWGKETINDKLSLKDYQYVIESLETLKEYKFNKKLLHGDFGTHNFVILNNKLVGIIDPQPVIGDPIYDYIFAIFSSTKVAKSIGLEGIFKITNEPKEKIKSMIIIILYTRIARCIRHHIEDLDDYLALWDKAAKL